MALAEGASKCDDAYTFGVITLFQEMFSAVLDHGVIGRGFREGRCQVLFENPRDYTEDAHRTVDDSPYGGGPGMVMKPEPLLAAIKSLKQYSALKSASVIYLSPQGRPVRQELVNNWASSTGVILLAGRYEGVDERLLTHAVDDEICVGDCVVSGGELPAMMLIDAIARQRPGVLGDPASAEQDSFVSGRLDWPHYTRPAEFEGVAVPKVLMSGNHKEIARWRQAQAIKRTLVRRPDLLEQCALSDEEKALLNQYGEQ